MLASLRKLTPRNRSLRSRFRGDPEVRGPRMSVLAGLAAAVATLLVVPARTRLRTTASRSRRLCRHRGDWMQRWRWLLAGLAGVGGFVFVGGRAAPVAAAVAGDRRLVVHRTDRVARRAPDPPPGAPRPAPPRRPARRRTARRRHAGRRGPDGLRSPARDPPPIGSRASPSASSWASTPSGSGPPWPTTRISRHWGGRSPGRTAPEPAWSPRSSSSPTSSAGRPGHTSRSEPGPWGSGPPCRSACASCRRSSCSASSRWSSACSPTLDL